MKLRNSYHRKILKDAIQEQQQSLKDLKGQLEEHEKLISSNTTWLQRAMLKYYAIPPMDKKLSNASKRHERKFKGLLHEHNISIGITNNPNETITNLTGDTITNEEESILRFGLKHGLATRPKETDIIATAESIWHQLNKEDLLPDSYTKRQKIKHSIKALACNILDFDDKRLHDDHRRIKILRQMNKKYAILKPDKGNGVVLLKKEHYIICMTQLFADSTKFCKIAKDDTLTQLSTLQNYLRTIHKRGEITDEIYNSIRPQSTKPARAHGLPKIHKPFDNLPPFRPIIDTTGTAYQPVAKYLSQLLNPLTSNAFCLKDSFDAVERIKNIPQHLFDEGFRFVSFDVVSLFTNIPLNKTIDIILDKIYKQNKIKTSIMKRTLKKLLRDACTKTPFSFNGELYRQTDGVSMGSPLSPTLANIIMTALEDEIIKDLIDRNIIKFYTRYVDDTLVLIKPSDISFVLSKLNSYHSQIQFTKEEFVDQNDVHFLDIKITCNGTTIFRKNTHTGQYIHFDSFTPWSHKVAWIKSLTNRAYKICSDAQLLSQEIYNIRKFMSWNGYPKKLSFHLIKQFAPKPQNTQNNAKTDEQNDSLPKIWIRLPFIGKHGTHLIGKFKKKISRLLKSQCKFIVNWDTTTTNTFVSNKDKTHKEFQSSVVYKFSCPGCNKSYIGKTERCLHTRLKEHTTSTDSEIFKHTNSCEHFNYLTNILTLNFDEGQPSTPVHLTDFLLSNTVIIDKAKHWSLLLFKESFAIRRHNPELNHGTKASLELSIFN